MAIPTEQMITEWKLDMKGNAKQIQDFVKEMRKEERVARAVEHATGRAAGEIDKFGRKVKKAGGDVNTLTGRVKNMGSKLSGLKVPILAVGASITGLVIGINKLMSTGLELGKMYDANTISIDKARASTRGYIADADLLKAANMSSAFGLGLTADSFAGLAEKATIAAQKIGGDVNAAMGDLMVGMARKSKPILDNLGIQMKSLDLINQEYAVSIGKSAKELTDLDKTAAFNAATIAGLNKVVGESKLTVKTAGDQWAVLKTQLKNTTDEFAVALLESGALKTSFELLTVVVKNFGSAMEGVEAVLGVLPVGWPLLISKVFEAEANKNLDEATKRLAAARKEYKEILDLRKEMAAGRADTFKGVGSPLFSFDAEGAFTGGELNEAGKKAGKKAGKASGKAFIGGFKSEIASSSIGMLSDLGNAMSDASSQLERFTFFGKLKGLIGGKLDAGLTFLSSDNLEQAASASSILAANVQKAMKSATSLPISNIPLVRMLDEETFLKLQQANAEFTTIKAQMDAMAISGDTASAAYRKLAAQLTVVGQTTIGAANKVTAFRQSIIDTSDDIGGMGKTAFQSFATALFNVADAAEASGESIETEILKALAATLKALAIEAGIKAIFSLAEYAASGFTDVTKLAAAGLYTAVAVAAGAAGAGVGAAAGASSSSGSTAATTSTSSKPTQFAQTVEDKRPVNINVFFNDPFDPSSSFVRQRQVTTAIGRSQTASS